MDIKKNASPLGDLYLAAFCEQIALILKSGISVYEGISIMAEDAEDAADRALLESIEKNLETTGDFSTALQESGAFPNYLCRMAAIGDRTGNLDVIMEKLEAHYLREAAVKKSTQSAIVYPLLLTGMMIAVILVLLVRVMPVFQQVFSELGTTMTGLPLTLMNIGNAIRTYALSFLILLGSLTLVLFVLAKTAQGRKFSKRLLLKLPAFKKHRRTVSACRFASNMSLILASGLSPDEGFELAMAANDDEDFAKSLAVCQNDLLLGEDLGQVLHKHHIFSGIYSRMMQIGSRTGTLDQVMGKIAALYQEEIDADISRLLAIIEPTLIVILCIAVGTILLSVMFPLLGIMGSL